MSQYMAWPTADGVWHIGTGLTLPPDASLGDLNNLLTLRHIDRAQIGFHRPNDETRFNEQFATASIPASAACWDSCAHAVTPAFRINRRRLGRPLRPRSGQPELPHGGPTGSAPLRPYFDLVPASARSWPRIGEDRSIWGGRGHFARRLHSWS